MYKRQPLERARNFDELLSGLHGTRYESIIKKAMNGKTEFSVQLLENVLFSGTIIDNLRCCLLYTSELLLKESGLIK